ncbi:MAG TPA: A/G-specific adenine glycosylase [Anaerolineales bacterium]|nr:A/G-specific adenine glycosylase [Anaerolineales bacterium]
MIDQIPFSSPLIRWYRREKRDFPWRDDPHPYKVWVCEIMAQQTRLGTVLPYFDRWMAAFPTLSDLAAADQQAVLNLWEGLGYYSRARNLHKAAQMVMDKHGGKLPANRPELEALPGIGRYTAGAIASIAFGLDEAVVDGNVKRVLARIFEVEEAVDTTQGTKTIWALAEAHLPVGQAADYNQALMELGARVCTPRQPDCEHCPAAGLCRANQHGRQTDLPVKKPKQKTPHYTVTASVIQRDGRVLIAQRPQDALLGGMWEFPGGKREGRESLANCLKREILEELGVKIEVGEKIGIFKHAYSHFKVTLHAYYSQLGNGTLEPQSLEHQTLHWVSLAELDDYPMGKIDRQISLELQKKNNGNP